MWKRSIAALFLAMIIAGVVSAHAQVVPSATKGQFTLTAGAFGSVFQPDYAGNPGPGPYYYPAAGAGPFRLYGFGGFVDARFRRWLQVEGEGRWLRYNQYDQITEDNYLIGPRFPIHTFHFMRATPYGKVLVGLGRMNSFGFLGHFTALEYGGGVDFKLTNRVSARGEFEYQQWPRWFTSSLYPYGASAGVSYRIFGGGKGLPKLTAKEKRE
jgi:opacity protein-like surface antigen